MEIEFKRSRNAAKNGKLPGVMSQTLAFLGTGLMGAPMAINLLKAGFHVNCYNRTAAKTEAVTKAGGHAFATPRAAVADAKIIVSCVTNGPDVEAIYFGENGAVGGAVPGALFVDMSTIAPAVAVSLGEKLNAQNFRFLEAPVTGGTVGATKGTLNVLAAGAREDFEEALPALSAMGGKITFCGGPGAGQGVKLCNQIMGAMNLLGVCEALVLSGKMGIDGKTLIEALSGGAATSWMLDNLAPKIIKGDYAPGFMVDTQQKDMDLVLEAAAQNQASLPGAALAMQLWRASQAAGDGGEGVHALFKVLAKLAALDE